MRAKGQRGLRGPPMALRHAAGDGFSARRIRTDKPMGTYPRSIDVISRKFQCITALCAAFGLASCSLSSESYHEEKEGYSATAGRIVKIENLTAERFEPLSDGVAITVAAPGCRVWLTFENEETRVFDIGRGVIIVHGPSRDYILESRLHPAGPTR